MRNRDLRRFQRYFSCLSASLRERSRPQDSNQARERIRARASGQ
jgi:hypothetical protein